jgi:YD repeat-containing protein
VGQLTSIVNANSTTGFTAFDALQGVTASSQATAGQTYAFAYRYNLAEALTSETYPSGRTVTTAYDGANRPLTLAGSLNGLTTNYVTQTSYWPSGGITSLTRGNNLVHAETYNSVLQLSGVTETASSGPLLSFVFNWSAPQTLIDNRTCRA